MITVKTSGTKLVVESLKELSDAMRPAVQAAVAELAEEAKEQIKRNIIACGALDTGAMLNSVITSNNFDKPDAKTPMASAEVDYPDMNTVNSKRPNSPIKKNNFYYAGVVESYQHFVRDAREAVTPKLEDTIAEKLSNRVG